MTEKTSLLLPCPLCGCQDASFGVSLPALHDDSEPLHCHDCDGYLSISTITDFLACAPSGKEK